MPRTGKSRQTSKGRIGLGKEQEGEDLPAKDRLKRRSKQTTITIQSSPKKAGQDTGHNHAAYKKTEKGSTAFLGGISRPYSAPFKRNTKRNPDLLPMSQVVSMPRRSRPKSSQSKRTYLSERMVQKDGFCPQCDKFGRTKPLKKHLAKWKPKRYIAGQRMRDPETTNHFLHDATVTVHREASLDTLLHHFQVSKCMNWVLWLNWI